MVEESISKMDYDAFGNQWKGDTPSPFGYCGEYLDSESGLIYLRNRYYDSTIGRFINEDPIKDGLNWYSYCGNNPIMMIDPSGLYTLEYDENGRVYAVIDLSAGDTLYNIAQAEVGNGNDWVKMGYPGDPGYLQDGEWVDITGIYNRQYPNPNPTAGTMGLSQFIQKACDEAGYKEAYENNTKYGEWYGMNGVEWCAIFVSWAANEAGLLGDVVPKYSYCYNGINWYKERGRFYTTSSGYIPKAGDVFFHSSDSLPYGGAHTGIVIAYKSGYIYTVEGNSDNLVRILKHEINYAYGFGSNGGVWSGEIPAQYRDGGGSIH